MRLNLFTADRVSSDKLTTHLDHEVAPGSRRKTAVVTTDPQTPAGEPTCLRMSAHNRADPVPLIAGSGCSGQ